MFGLGFLFVLLPFCYRKSRASEDKASPECLGSTGVSLLLINILGNHNFFSSVFYAANFSELKCRPWKVHRYLCQML